MHAHARQNDRGSLQQVCLEAHNIGSARQFQADEGVQSIEGMEAVQKQLVCVSLPFVTNILHGAIKMKIQRSAACIVAFEAFQHIYRSSV